MKTRHLSRWSVFFLLTFGAFGAPARGDSPAAFNYQGVARNLDGTPVANRSVTVRLTIRSGTATGTVLYQETHPVTTTDAGQFALVIGAGTQVSVGAAFADLSWTTSTPRFLQTELSIAGGAFVDMGATQFVSVPYALEANHATVADGLSNTKLVPIATATIDDLNVFFTSTSATVPIQVQSGNPSGLFVGSGRVTAIWDEENNWYEVGVTGHDLNQDNCVVLVTPRLNGNPLRTFSTSFIVPQAAGDPGKISVKFARIISGAEGSPPTFERGRCSFFIAIYKMGPNP